METRKGIVSKIKILKMTPSLIFFKVDDANCLIAKHALNFLADVDEGMEIAVAEYLNKRKQFVISKYAVMGKTKIMMEIEMLQSGVFSKIR